MNITTKNKHQFTYEKVSNRLFFSVSYFNLSAAVFVGKYQFIFKINKKSLRQLFTKEVRGLSMLKCFSNSLHLEAAPSPFRYWYFYANIRFSILF